MNGNKKDKAVSNQKHFIFFLFQFLIDYIFLMQSRNFDHPEDP